MEDSELMTRARTRIGTVLRRKYRIDRVLGVGGMAVVYAATHEVNRAEFAIKMLHPELSIRKDIATRFLREGLVGNTVKHKGAVKVLDNDVAEDGAAFLVMELLDGAGVEQVWEKRRCRLPVPVVLAIAYQLLDVLAAAHAKQIVHRDIKPANLFLTREGVVKVLDFGIARLRDATAESATHTGMLLGTPAFMAPEQALAQSSQIDGLSDVWAAGATMFSLLSGQMVHVGDNAQQLMVQAATRPARSLNTVAPEVSPRVVAIVDRALAFDKSQRWPGAFAMRDAVRDAYQAELSSSISIAPLVALFDESDVGHAQTLYADSTGSGVAGEASSPTATSAAVPETVRARGAAIAPTIDDVMLHRAGGTTAQPVSQQVGEVTEARPRRSGTVVVAGVTLAALAVGAFGAIKLRPGASSSAPPAIASTAEPSAAPAPPTASVTLAPLPSTVLQPLAGLAVVPEVPDAGPASRGKTRPGAAPAAAPGTVPAPPAPAPQPAVAPSPVPAAPPPKPVVNCDPPWVMGADGIKHWKDECTK